MEGPDGIGRGFYDERPYRLRWKKANSTDTVPYHPHFALLESRITMKQLFASIGILVAVGIGLLILQRSFSTGGRHDGDGKGIEALETGSGSAAEQGQLGATEPLESAGVTNAAELSAGSLADSASSRQPARHAGLAREGRIVIPSGSPSDPTLRVLFLKTKLTPNEIYGKAGVTSERVHGLSGAVLAAARVEPDGSFTFQLEEKHTEVWAAIDGRFLFSLAPTRFDSKADETLLLEARLGAAILGSVIVPPREAGKPDEPGSFAEMSVSLLPDQDQFALMSSDAHWLFNRHVLVDENGTFEFRGLDPVRPYEAEVESENHANQQLDDLELFPGQSLRVEARLRVGARLIGRVIGNDELPVAGATVEAVKTVMFGFAGDALAKTETDEQGAFDLSGVPLGKATIIAKAKDRLESLPLTLNVADGEIKRNLELKIESGNSITGSVTWADGKPAVDARVRVEFDPEAMMGMSAMNMARGASGSGRTREDGSFSVHGLGKGPFLVTARKRHRSAPENAAEHTAEQSGVQPGASIQLILIPPTTLVGRVLDLDGQPIENFEIHASSQGAAFFVPGQTEKRSFSDPDGRFAIEGLGSGTWALEARAAGYGPSQATEREIPGPKVLDESEELVLVLEPEANVAGKVLDPDGNPVSGAKVTLQTERERTVARLAGQLDLPESYSDEEGAFVLEGLASGDLSLVATHRQYAASEPLPLELEAGEVHENVVLQLRKGARLSGEVFDKEGKLAAGAQIILQDPNNWDTRMQKTDVKGAFLVENLRPGVWNVTALVGQIDSMAIDSSSENGSAAESTSAFMENMRFTMVDLEDGQEEHVILGAPAENPVLVSGKVTHGGEGADGAMVSFFPDGAKGFSAMKFTVVKSNGGYEISLDKPGRYHVQVQLNTTGGSMSQENVEYSELVPNKESHKLDIELPLGRIAGRVIGPDGKPSPNTRMTLTTAGGMSMGTILGGQYAEITTNSSGNYTFDFLRSGEYDLAAGGALFGGAFGTGSPQGRLIKSGLKVSEGAHLDGIDFRLKGAGDIAGKIVDMNGKAIQNAAIFVRDSEGRLLERFSMITSDHDGTFRYRGLQPGDYQVTARKDDLTSPDSEWVSVREGGSARVNVTLSPGAILLVTVTDKTTENLPDAKVSVTDEAGRELHGMISYQEILQNIGGFHSDEYRFGPLAPGKYTVRAVATDGRDAKRVVRVAPGEKQRKVRLRLR